MHLLSTFTLFCHLSILPLALSFISTTTQSSPPPSNAKARNSTNSKIDEIQDMLNKTLDQMTLDDVKKTKYYKEGRLEVPLSTEAGEQLHEHWVQQAFSGLMAAVATRKMKYMEDYEKKAHEKCAKEADDMELHAQCLVRLLDADSKHRWLRRWKYFSKEARRQMKSASRESNSRERSSDILRVGSFSQEFSSEERASAAKRRQTSQRRAAVEKALTQSRQMQWRRQMVESTRRPAFRVLTVKKSQLASSTPLPASSKQLRAATTAEQRRQYAVHSYSRHHHHYVPHKKTDDWVGSFRMARAKREIVTRNSYQLKSEFDNSPFNIIAKHLTKTVRIIKGKNGTKSWQETINEIKGKGDELKRAKKAKEAMRKRLETYANAARRFSKDVQKVQEKPVTIKKKRPLAMPELDAVEDMIEDEQLKELIRKKADNMTEEDMLVQMPVRLIKEVIKLGMEAGGMNTSDFNKMNLKLASPRFMSVVPEDEEEKKKSINVFSPSLFSLHGEGKGIEKQTSLSSLIKNLGGGKSSGKQDWLDFVVEATGVAEAVDDAMGELEKKEFLAQKDFVSQDGMPLYFTKENVTKLYGRKESRKIEIMEKLERTYTADQLKELNRTGYTVLNEKQRHVLYGPGSPYYNPVKLQQLRNVTDTQVHRTVHSTIRSIAKGETKIEVRQNDIVLSPIVNSPLILAPEVASQPIILSPVLASPLIGSPAIFGVVILSPWVFVPVILSPRILSPIVLSPFMLSPIVLSPLALTPAILSPGVLVPVVLSPLVMVPFVLSPQVMTPIILSPFALSPFILSPTVLTPLILSPFVLSPSVLSPGYVTALVLSPYALRQVEVTFVRIMSVLMQPVCAEYRSRNLGGGFAILAQLIR